MANMLKDKVVLVTGAGGGIGREMALLGGPGRRQGRGQRSRRRGRRRGRGSATPAEKVCDEIKAAGGQAVANGDSVVRSGRRRAHGQGGGRELRPHRRRHQQCRHPARPHLPSHEPHGLEAWSSTCISTAAFNVSRAAANYFKEQKSGAFVHFTSTSGLVGNFGQANYSAAKMGIVGLSRSIALDMAAFNVRSNCISPFAWTRMIGTIPADTDAAEGAPGALQEDDRRPRSRRWPSSSLSDWPAAGHHLADLRRAHERDHAVQRQPPGTLRA